MPDVSVLIANWNSGGLLGPCVASLAAAAEGLSMETIIIDNASSDGSGADLPCEPWLHVVRRTDNVGFAAGTNQAASLAKGRMLLLLNPDTECRPGAISQLAHALDGHPGIAAIGPRLVYPDGRLQRSAWRGYPGVLSGLIDAGYLWKMPSLPFVSRFEVRDSDSGAPQEVEHLLGACILVSAKWWETVGPLDEGYFLFLEETDWCRRARDRGGRIVYWPVPEVVHYGQQSVYQVPIQTTQQYYRSYVRFVRRSGGWPGRVAVLKAVIGGAALARLAVWCTRWFRSRSTLSGGMLRGYWTVLRDVRRY